MNPLEQYLEAGAHPSDRLWQQSFAGTLGAIHRADAAERLAAPPSPAWRDLAAEHAVLRTLVQLLPHLKLRKLAGDLGLPVDTYDSLFAEKHKAKYRPLTNPLDADILWSILRDTARFLLVALPDRYQP